MATIDFEKKNFIGCLKTKIDSIIECFKEKKQMICRVFREIRVGNVGFERERKRLCLPCSFI